MSYEVVFGQLQHSPDPTTTIFLRPRRLRRFLLQKSRFEEAKEIQGNAMGLLLAIPKKKLQECFHQGKRH